MDGTVMQLGLLSDVLFLLSSVLNVFVFDLHASATDSFQVYGL